MRKKPKPLKVIVTYGERPTAQQFFCSLYNVTPRSRGHDAKNPDRKFPRSGFSCRPSLRSSAIAHKNSIILLTNSKIV